MLWNSKKGRDNMLDFYKGINYERPESDQELFNDCILKDCQKQMCVIKINKVYNADGKTIKLKNRKFK